jgi:hypothetical protein
LTSSLSSDLFLKLLLDESIDLHAQAFALSLLHLAILASRKQHARQPSSLADPHAQDQGALRLDWRHIRRHTLFSEPAFSLFALPTGSFSCGEAGTNLKAPMLGQGRFCVGTGLDEPMLL